jgi:hypothetical protein
VGLVAADPPERQPEPDPGLPVEPAQGDPAAEELLKYIHRDSDRCDWPAVRDFFSGVSDPDDRAFYLTLLRYAPPPREWLGGWMAAEPRSALPLLVAGVHGVYAAWSARGGLLARQTGADRIQEFQRWLAPAEEYLFEAARRDPDDPVPWTYLVMSGRGRQVGLAESWRRWRSAIERHRWSRMAHEQMLQQLCAKWGGSHELMHSFAEETAAQAPTGTCLAGMVAIAHLEHWSYLPPVEDATYLKRPNVVGDLNAAADRSIRHPVYRRRPGWAVLHNLFAMAFFLAGDHESAAEQFDELGNLYTEWPWQYLDGAAPGRRYAMARALSPRATAD